MSQETLRGARDRAVAAVHNAFSVARQLPQSVGTRVTQTAQGACLCTRAHRRALAACSRGPHAPPACPPHSRSL